MMLLRVRTLAMGCSGARPEVAEAIVALLNAGLTPVVPEHGSLGASGDLAPLAHCALALIGEGSVGDSDGVVRPAARGAGRGGHRAGAAGRQGGPGADQRHRRDARDARAGDRGPGAAAQGGRHHRRDVGRGAAGDRPRVRRGPRRAPAPARPGRERRQPARAAGGLRDRRQPPRGRPARAGRVFAALRAAGGRRRARHARLTPGAWPAPSCARRSTTRWCCPTAASSRAATSTARRSGIACDFLAIAAADVGAIAERRTDRLLDATRSHGLPPFLADDPGVDSGLMLAHYAQAAIVAEGRRLAAPASVDSLPTSAMQEDHVSMGWGAARKLRSRGGGAGARAGGRARVRGPGARSARAAAPGAWDRRGAGCAAVRRRRSGARPVRRAGPRARAWRSSCAPASWSRRSEARPVRRARQ